MFIRVENDTLPVLRLLFLLLCFPIFNNAETGEGDFLTAKYAKCAKGDGRWFSSHLFAVI
jgi:hypothetical protein